MKKLIIFASIMMVSVTTQAIAAEPVDSRQDYCRVIADVSEYVMKSRQMGMEMNKLLDIEGSSQVPFWEGIVIAAYKQPKFSTEEHQHNASQEFRNKYYIKCMEKRL